MVCKSGLHGHKGPGRQESRREDLVLTLTAPYILPANLAGVWHPSYSQLVHKQRSLGLHFCALYSGIL
jgi:hypothetical protein